MKVQVEKHRQQKQEEEEFIKQQQELWEEEERERKKQISAREITKFRQRVGNKQYRSVLLVLVTLLREYAYSANPPWLPKLKKKLSVFRKKSLVYPSCCLPI